VLISPVEGSIFNPGGLNVKVPPEVSIVGVIVPKAALQ
jgi:hypothetical protein